jgi:predicted HTH transcriptional regulator
VADPKVTRKGLADQIGKTEDTVKYHLASLQDRKIIIHVGPDNGGYSKVLF